MTHELDIAFHVGCSQHPSADESPMEMSVRMFEGRRWVDLSCSRCAVQVSVRLADAHKTVPAPTPEYVSFLALLEAVRQRLQADGLTVSIEHPGCIVIWAEDLVSHPDRSWWFGTNSAMWAGDLNDSHGYHHETRTTDVPSDCTDATRIAEAILTVLSK